jgi:predicted lactoylglutathione lyase
LHFDYACPIIYQKEFFGKLGFSFNPQFTDDKAACLVISDNIFAMLLTEPFKTFTKKDVADASRSTEAIIALDAQSRQQVDEIAKKAVEAGGSMYKEVEDHGWMYGKSFADLYGHQWEILYMDEAAIKQVTTQKIAKIIVETVPKAICWTITNYMTKTWYPMSLLTAQ